MMLPLPGTVHGDSDRDTAVDGTDVDQPQNHAVVDASLKSPDCAEPVISSRTEPEEPVHLAEPAEPADPTDEHALPSKQSQERICQSFYMWSEAVWCAYVSYAPDMETKVARITFARTSESAAMKAAENWAADQCESAESDVLQRCSSRKIFAVRPTRITSRKG